MIARFKDVNNIFRTLNWKLPGHMTSKRNDIWTKTITEMAKEEKVDK